MRGYEARTAWQEDRADLMARGFIAPDIESYYPEGMRKDWTLAYDALPALSTDPNSALPVILTTMIDPEVTRYIFAPLKIAEITGEEKRGDWLQDVIMFPLVEHTGEVAVYGDDNNSGAAGVNENWPQRQSYLAQIVKQYGQRALERAGLGKIDYVSELDKAAVDILNRFMNNNYAFGMSGLQNYGLLNDPSLSAALTPGTKSAGNGNVWLYSGMPNATANEVYADIQALYSQLVKQTASNIDRDTPMTLALSSASETAMSFTNGFNVNVTDLVKKNFPNINVKTAPQYGALSSLNPQGIAAGNMVQLIVDNLEGGKTMFSAFNEKARAFPIIKEMSSFKQKMACGVWGCIVRRPLAIASMVGI